MVNVVAMFVVAADVSVVVVANYSVFVVSCDICVSIN